MHCPHCTRSVAAPPDFWRDRVAPWSCSYCGKLYGFSNNQQVFPIPEEFRPLAPLLPESIAKRWCYYAHPCNYVYALCYPTGIPFYVGLGRGKRALAHLTEAIRQNSANKPLTDKQREIAHLLTLELGVWFHFLALTKDRVVAEEAESYWIDLWGLRINGGMLANDDIPNATPSLIVDLLPKIPAEEHNETQHIETFNHPDLAVCPDSKAERDKNAVPLTHIACTACGQSNMTESSMCGKYLICWHCGHYIYGLDFRERFPLKQFADKQFVWTYRRKSQ